MKKRIVALVALLVTLFSVSAASAYGTSFAQMQYRRFLSQTAGCGAEHNRMVRAMMY